MSKRNRKNRRNRGGRAAQPTETEGSGSSQAVQGAGYASIAKENEDFVKFYKMQNIVPEGQWDHFMESLRESLPTTFRITGFKSQAKALLEIIKGDYLTKLMQNNDSDESNDVHLINLPWYPDNLAWQLNRSRKVLRKTEACERLHNFLTSETASGNISRQEAVSMIPPLVLDVQPHHKVLDMCAAPGSKTAQLLEMIHADNTIVPDGVVLANDADNKRCYMLVHQVKRLQSPCLLITNHDAGVMPNIQLSETDPLKFDRILCDVPCSGDGTIRKNIDIWMKWNVANSLNFHGLQARILKRGLELLNVGGMLVYSTCSLCPIEDESVIHHMLSLCEGSVELVDVSDKLPGLKFVPGLSYWKITNRELDEIVSPEEIPEKNKNQISAQMFPPKAEEAPKYNLQRCIRILPHFQNTGGFFVAVLKKNSVLPWEIPKAREEGASNSVESTNGAGESASRRQPPKKKRKTFVYREDPFVYFDKDDPLWPGIQGPYDIDSSFDQTLLLTRCREGKRRTLYFTSKLVKDILKNNEEKLKVINTGIKLFSRCDSKKSTPMEFRITQEGLLTVMPYVHKRVIRVLKSDIVYLLTTNFPDIKKFSETALEGLKEYENGSVVLMCENEEDATENNHLKLALCAWKGATSLRAYVAKNEKMHYLRLCGVDTFQYERKKFQQQPSENQVEKEGGGIGNEDISDTVESKNETEDADLDETVQQVETC